MKPPSPASPPGSAPAGTSAGDSTPPLRALSYDEFRRRLAGLTDPERREATAGERQAVKDSAVRLCALLAKHFGDGLDRLTLWDRIGSAWEVGLSKIGGDPDLFRLASLLLEHVQADPARAAACPALASVYGEWDGWPDETRHAFLAYCRSHRYPLLTFGRTRWQRALEEAKARKAAGGESEVQL